MDTKTLKTAKRRGARGEGSISKRKDGSWQAALSLGRDAAGNRVRQTVYGKTQREVRDKLDGLRADRRQGKKPASRRTVAAYLTAWLTATGPTVRPKTFEMYSYAVNSHLIPALGAVELEKLTVAHVSAMMAERIADGKVGARTVAHLRAVLRGALSEAVRQDLLTRNVASLAKPPRVEESDDVKHFTSEQVVQFLAAVQGDRLEALYITAIAIGARQGELLGLRWEDIDFAARTVTISKQLQRVGGKYVYPPLKTKKSRRTVALPATLTAALTAHRDRQEPLPAGEVDLVFRTAQGLPLNGTAVTHSFQRLSLAAGVPEMDFHGLRHTCASLLFARGISARAVMELLGHSSIAVTMNTYTHMMPADRALTADAMDGALGG